MTTFRCCLLLALLAAPLAHAQLVGTAFTYQGALSVNDLPADGAYDLRFDAYPAAGSGAALNAAPVVLDNVAIADGVFTVEVDFGNAVFLGAPVFLEIGVREGAAGGPGDVTGFQGLSPRQRVRPAPYALHAEEVALESIGTAQITDGSVGSADIDDALVQRRVTANCAPGASIRAIATDGGVTCEPDNDAVFSAGIGIATGPLASGSVEIDPAVVPRKDAAGGNQTFDTDLLFLDYTNNRVGILNSAGAAGFALDVSGRVRATEYHLPNLRTGDYGIAASNFVQSGIGLDDDTYQFPQNVYSSIAGTAPIDVRLSAPVHPQRGSSLQTLSCEVYDNDAALDLTFGVNLMRLLPNSITVGNISGSSLTTSGASGALQTISAPISPGTVGTGHIYSLIATFSITGTSTLLRFYGCRISYNYSELGL